MKTNDLLFDVNVWVTVEAKNAKQAAQIVSDAIEDHFECHIEDVQQLS